MSIEERVARLEDRLGVLERRHGVQIREVRAELNEKVGNLAEEHRQALEKADALAQREARFNLAGPALLTFVGLVLQAWAVFV